MANLVCYNCSHSIALTGIVGRQDECPKCRLDVHVCKNCEFYDSKVYNECKETQADVVRDKEKSNYCDYFTAKKDGVGGVDKAAALRAAAEALFKKS